MNLLYPVTVRKYNNEVFQYDNYSLPTEESIKAFAVNVPATASRVTTVATVNLNDHGFKVGDTVNLIGDAPFTGAVVVTAVNQNSFNFTVADSGATSANIYVTITELYVNQYIGGAAQPVKYTITQTIAQLFAAVPAGACINATITNDSNTNDLTLPSLGTNALFFTAKICNMMQNVYPTLTFTDMDRSGSTVTVTSASHGLQVGQFITVDSSNNALDGTYAVATVPTANTFTYTTTTSGTVTDATGTGYMENTKLLMYEEGAKNKPYILNQTYAVLINVTDNEYSFTSASLTTAALTSATFTASNAAAVTGRNVVGATISAYSGTYGTNGIPQLLSAVVSSNGVITFTIYNAHATNALNGTLTIVYELSN